MKRRIDIKLTCFLFGTIILLFMGFPDLCTAQSVNEVERLNKEVVKLYKQGLYKEAILIAKRALAIREKVLGPEHPNVAESLNVLANLYQALGDYGQAEPLYKRALAINEKSLGPNHPPVATSLNNLASLYKALGDYGQAEPLYKRALAINEKALGTEHPRVASSLDNLASLYMALGDYGQAEPLFLRALGIREKSLGFEHSNVAISYNNLASLYDSLGDYIRAEPLYKHALEIYEKALGTEHPYFATCLNNLANLYQALGDYGQAEILYKRALEIDKKALGPEHPRFATSLNNLASLYMALGDYGQAEPLFNQALVIDEKVFGTEHPNVAAILNNLAMLYESIGDYSKVEPLLKRALSIRQKTLGQNHPEVISSLINLAEIYLEIGKTDEAFKIFNKTNSSMGKGEYYLTQGNYQKAKIEFQESMKYAQLRGQKKFIITAHICLGLSYEGLKDLETAKKHFEEAIELIESQWQTLGLSARTNFLVGEVGGRLSRLDAYEGMIRVIIKQKKMGYQKEALEYAEQTKSRTLLEMLAAKGTISARKKDQEILAKDRKFQKELAMLRKKITRLTEQGSSNHKRALERVEQSLYKTLQAYERFINEVKLQDMELASLVTVTTAPIKRIQSVLEPSTTILEYFTTRDSTYAWLITKDAIKVHKLDLGKKQLVSMINKMMLPNISNRSRRPDPIIKPSTRDIFEAESSKAQRQENRQRFLQATMDFYQKLLAPLTDDIGTNQLIVVPHGPLHKVPFAALNDGNQFLVDKYTLSVVPSATAIEYVIKNRNNDNGRLLAFANPETEYLPLEFSEIEVKDISTSFIKKEVYFKKDATEGRARERSSFFDTIHFACHGEFNDKQPMQSGLLLTKDSENDGYLQVHEIFGLDLREANLVVLSACDTALSKIYGGDDLVGLSRGFIYAGTPSILASLWEVEDHSTSILMKAFYENLYKRDMNKAQALQQAQLAVKAIAEYQHPYYWAPFILIGDWR